MAWRGLVRPAASEPGRPPSRTPRHALEMLVALSLAFLVWLYFRTRDKESLDQVPIPVQITLAPEAANQYDLETPSSPHVVVSFVGPPSRIRELRGMLQRGEVRAAMAVTVPPDRQSDSRYRATVRVQAADVAVPPGVMALVAEGDNRIPVTLHRLIEQRLPVRLNNALEDRISQVTLEPATVLVRGPQDILERARSVPTTPYALPASFAAGQGKQQLSVRLPLVREMEGRPIRATPGSVKVELVLRPRPKVYELKQVPVKFLCPTSFPYRPQFPGERGGRITLRVRAPASAHPPAVVAFIDLTSGDFKPGLNVEPLRLQLPGDCQLAQDPPGAVAFELIPTETASRWLGVVTEP